MFVVSEWAFTSVPPLTLAFFRVAVGTAVLLPFVRLRGERLPREQWRLAAT
jgi:drug/metabolite transporter (DMT)-like permease